MLAALAARQPIEQRVALVVAHPDDETLAAGGSLRLMSNLLLVHVTDGAPRRLGDAAEKGFASPEQYARARKDELDLALALAESNAERITLDVPDQEAINHLDEITECLQELCAAHRIEIVMTHCYEGGHPDHDAVAFAVHAGRLPVIEFAGYHADDAGQLLPQSFLPYEGSATVSVSLPPSDLSRKRNMLQCFRTQAKILSHFDPAIESFRAAPHYDFSQPPHGGRLLYEQWGWMDWNTWHERARRSRCAA